MVNLKTLTAFADGEKVTPRVLRERGLIKSVRLPLKVLGNGELGVKLEVVAHAFSEAARKAIEQQGGTCEIIG